MEVAGSVDVVSNFVVVVVVDVVYVCGSDHVHRNHGRVCALFRWLLANLLFNPGELMGDDDVGADNDDTEDQY